MSRKVLELRVNNHPGVMSHVAGLFSRRAFNIEGILCGPVGDGRLSRMYLLVDEDRRLQQLLRQLEKLHDVLDVRERTDCKVGVFMELEELVREDSSPHAC
jgi:acetolactate synthase-1/3 small subunit